MTRAITISGLTALFFIVAAAILFVPQDTARAGEPSTTGFVPKLDLCWIPAEKTEHFCLRKFSPPVPTLAACLAKQEEGAYMFTMLMSQRLPPEAEIEVRMVGCENPGTKT